MLLAGKYQILAEVGRGGMGAVYVAHHVALDQRVAVKVLAGHAALDVARFVREARAAAKLKSEHVVRVSDVGTADGVGAYMVMEYLVGSDLGQMLDAHGPLPISEAIDAVVEVTEALAEAHSLGIVHRDLKPSNLFLAQRTDHASIVKVLDFGISKMTNFDDATQKLTETRALIGSPHYMSPEQLRSARDVDGRADIWSLGVVLYELLTASMPFDGQTAGAVFANVLETIPKPVRSLRPDVPEQVDAVVARCLRRDPRERFQYVAELSMALAPFGTARARAAAERAGAFGTFSGRSPSASGPMPSLPAPVVHVARAKSPAWQSKAAERSRVPAAAIAFGVVLVLSLAAIGVFLAVGRTKASLPRPPAALSTKVSAPVLPESPALRPEPSTAPTSVPTASAIPPTMPSAATPGSGARPRAVPRPSASAAPAPSEEPDLDRRR